MAANTPTLFCLISGESASNAFPVKISSDKTVGVLKELIKTEKTPEFRHIDVSDLVLWHVLIPIVAAEMCEPVILDALSEKKMLNNPRTSLSKLFLESSDDNTYIIVQPPPSAPKRDREDDVAHFPKETRLETDELMDAIEEAGLTDKATVNDGVALSRLDNKEKVSVLGFLGSSVTRDDSFNSLSTAALALRKSSFQEIEVLSTPFGSNALFPVVGTKDLFVRQAYKDLYQEVSHDFPDSPRNEAQSHFVLTGTSGIGKSAFLVYFTIRRLATSSDDNPSIVIFQVRGESKCYVYGGPSTLRYGDIKVFEPFLDLPETWYLVDSSPNPRLEEARTIISASPKTLFSEYREVEKRVVWYYYMAPWMLEELEQCWDGVEGFKVVPKDLMEKLYGMVGGVPRYVLEKPMRELRIKPGDIAGAEKVAYRRVRKAIISIRAQLEIMECFEEGIESLKNSNRLLHCWSTENHRDFHLEWASTYIADELGEPLRDVTWQQILKKLSNFNHGKAMGPIFELYVRHIFRKGGCEFQIRDLQDGSNGTLKVPTDPSVELFNEISAVPPGTLCIPKTCNDTCINLLLSPRHLFQVTVSLRHGIKGPLFSKLLENLMDKGWIHSSKEAHLVFIVPSEIYDNFPEQKYLSTTGAVYEIVPQQMQLVKQFVLKIDLKAASTGKSPGIRGPAY